MEKPTKRLTPQEVVLNAFVYFTASSMDEESLIIVCLAGGCPSRDIARGVLDRMVESGKLTKTKENKMTMYTPKPLKKTLH